MTNKRSLDFEGGESAYNSAEWLSRLKFVLSRRRKESLCANQEAVGTNCLHGLAPTASVHLLQDSMDVIPHGELREIQAGGDFLIRKSLGDKNHQLLLTHSKIRS